MNDIKRRLLRRKQVEEITGISRSSIYARMDEGTFPQSIPIGQKAVAWLEHEIQEWIEEQIRKARG